MKLTVSEVALKLKEHDEFTDQLSKLGSIAIRQIFAKDVLNKSWDGYRIYFDENHNDYHNDKCDLTKVKCNALRFNYTSWEFGDNFCIDPRLVVDPDYLDKIITQFKLGKSLCQEYLNRKYKQEQEAKERAQLAILTKKYAADQ